MKIEIKNLTKKFDNFTAVDNISFDFTSGHIVGFIGPNGAGKTTTMKMMSTLDLPTRGDILYDGISAVQNPEDVRQIVGYMPDSLPAHNDIEVWEYLDFFARAYGLRGSKKTSVLKGVEEFTGLGKMRNKVLASLSKGMKQRVSLGRAILHDPQVLIMDEPAAGLDPRARIELRELMQVLVDQGKAILISSHILSELQGICTGTVIIDHGKILQSGHVKDVMEASFADAKHLNIYIKSLHGADLIQKSLLELPQIDSFDVTELGEVKVAFEGDYEASSHLLKALVERNLAITEFRHETRNLEDLFMNVTKG